MKKILLGIVIAVVVIFGGLYLLGASDDGSGTKPQGSSAIYSPTEVVTMYTRATLGTIPGALIDYTLAETLLGEPLLSEFDGGAFIPMSYGIQDGPDKIEFVDEKIKGDTATVRVWGYWGGNVGRDWTFTLEKEDDQWLITNLDVVEPTDQQ